MRRLRIRCARYRPDVVDLHNALVDGYGRVLSPAATEAALRNSLERTRQKHLVSGKELYLREETPALLTSTSTCATGERGGPGPDGPASHGGSTRLRKAKAGARSLNVRQTRTVGPQRHPSPPLALRLPVVCYYCECYSLLPVTTLCLEPIARRVATSPTARALSINAIGSPARSATRIIGSPSHPAATQRSRTSSNASARRAVRTNFA